MTLRRLYLYVVSAASLVVLALGLVNLGATILLFVFNDPNAQQNRTALAIYAAMSIVALPVWGVHFWFAQRFATRDPYERTSAIRHLYLYLACLGFAVASMVNVAVTLGEALRPVLDNQGMNAEMVAQGAWATVVTVDILAIHFFIAVRDRQAVHEEGRSATLRRWYMYTALLVGLLTMLSFTQQLLMTAWTALVAATPTVTPDLAVPAGAALAGALMWGFHARVIATQHIADDRHSTLRAVEGFIAVAISIISALFGASLVLYYAVARALGVDSPGGASNDLLTAAAGPASLFLVYGVAWFLLNRRLARDGASQEADRQAGVRRLYTNLVALISLGAWASGAVVLLGTLLAQVEGPIIGARAPDWRDPISLGATLVVVGAAVWLAHWRQSPWATDRQAFSRRLYVWAALLGSALAGLVAGVNLVYVVLQQVFSANPRLDDPQNLGFARSLAVIVVGVGVAAYHWRVLRMDAAARPARPAPAPKPAVVAAASAASAASASSKDKPTQPAEVTGPHAHRYTLVVTDASEDDVHQALSSLPPQAGYKLTPAEQAVDGR